MGLEKTTRSSSRVCRAPFRRSWHDHYVAWEGVNEEGWGVSDPERVLVKTDPAYFRPTEVDLLDVSRCMISHVQYWLSSTLSLLVEPRSFSSPLSGPVNLCSRGSRLREAI